MTFRDLIHFEFIFVYGVRKCSNFVLLHVAEAQAAATGALSAAERSYPTSEVRGRSREDPMPEGWRPREARGGGREEQPHARGQGRRPRSGGCAGAGGPRGDIPR